MYFPGWETLLQSLSSHMGYSFVTYVIFILALMVYIFVSIFLFLVLHVGTNDGVLLLSLQSEFFD